MSVKYHAPKQIAFFALSASVLLLVAAPVKAFSTNQRDILILKIFLGISSTMAGATLLWQHRPSRIDDTLEKLGETAQLQQQRIAEVNQQVQQTVVNTVNKANERILAVEQEYKSLLEQKDQEAQQLRQQLAQAHYPKLPPETTPANCSCRAIQLALWREGVILDWDRNQPATKVIGEGKEYDQYILEPRNQNHMVKFLKMRSDAPSICEFALGEDGAVKIIQSGNRIVFKYFPGEETTRKQKQLLEQKKAYELESLPTLDDAVKKNLGFLLAGEPGSGKTSTALALIKAFQDKPLNKREKEYFPNPEALEIIALDIHAQANPSWQEHNLFVVYEPLAILNQLHLLHDEYTAREQGRKGNRLVIVFDEFEETLGKIEEHLFNISAESKEIKRELNFIRYFVRSLASGGRKFGINLILINHSFNCTALKIDSNHRNNFVGIFLNEAADNYVSRAGYANQKVKDWVIKTRVNKYRAVITGAMKDSPILHPTHHDYDKVEDGQKSKLLIELAPSELTIKVVKLGVIKSTKTQNDKFSANSPLNKLDSTENQSSKGLDKFSGKFSDEVSSNSPLESVDNYQTQSNQGLYRFSVPDYPPKNPKIIEIDQGENLAPEDLARLEKIHELWAVGEKRITRIIPQVWADIRGDKSPQKWVKSRGYRKCREEYRRLTGK